MTNEGRIMASYQVGGRDYSLERGLTRTHVVCRATEMAAGSGAAATTLRAAGGARYTLAQDASGTWRLGPP